MKKDEALEILKTLTQIKKETAIIEESEKEKYSIGLMLKESIEGLRICICSFSQPKMKEQTRKEKINYLKNIGLNLLDVCRILSIGDGSPAHPSEFNIEGKRKPLRSFVKRIAKVSK